MEKNAHLSSSLEPCLELPLPGGDDEHSEVGLGGAPDHVGHEGLVPGSVQDGKMLLVRLEVGPTNLHSLPLVSFWKTDPLFTEVILPGKGEE